ncbi:MAG TPA: SMP-30/gluconolactonase/LRE family protein [Segetibacter sp.]|jgi:sugar lactone lactonase YvrE
MKVLYFTFILLTGCLSKLAAQLIHSKDFTAENLFSRNIEGPAINKTGQLFVVNFGKDGTIGKVNSDGSCEFFVTLPEGSIANSIQFNSKGNMLLADFTKHNILEVDTKTKSISVYCNNNEFNQPNDLCINSKDQLFASDPNWKEGTGKLWRIDANRVATLLADNMGTTNGIELSPDEKKLYVNESVQRRVWVFDVDGAGNISNKKLFIAFDDFGLDGMKCDKEGNLYITRYGAGTISVVSRHGLLLREVILKGKNCSNLVFGGEDGKTVYVTLQDRKGIETFRNDVVGKRF